MIHCDTRLYVLRLYLLLRYMNSSDYFIVLVVYLHLLSKDVCVFLISKVRQCTVHEGFVARLVTFLWVKINCYLYTNPKQLFISIIFSCLMFFSISLNRIHKGCSLVRKCFQKISGNYKNVIMYFQRIYVWFAVIYLFQKLISPFNR